MTFAHRWRRSSRERIWQALRVDAVPAEPREEVSDDLSRTFAALKPRERALLWLAYVEGEDHQEIAEAPPWPRATLPDARILWLKAQLLRRWDAERTVQAPLDIMEPVQITAGLAAAVLLLLWPLPHLLKWFGA